MTRIHKVTESRSDRAIRAAWQGDQLDAMPILMAEQADRADFITLALCLVAVAFILGAALGMV